MKTKATSRIFKQTFAWILALMMVFSVFPATQVNAATKPKLSKTKITMTVGQSKKLKVKGISKKRAKRIKWKSSKKKVVTVTKTGKLKARKAGKAVITAKVGKKKLKCKVTVKKKRKKSTKKKKSKSSSKKMWLSKTNVTLQAGSGVDLVLHNAKNVVKWSSSNKKVAWVERDTTYKNHGAVQLRIILPASFHWYYPKCRYAPFQKIYLLAVSYLQVHELSQCSPLCFWQIWKHF